MDGLAIRRFLRERHVRAAIPEKRLAQGCQRHRRGRPPCCPAKLYAQRNVVERFIGWLKEHRRIATRFEKLAQSFLAMLHLACIKRLLHANFSNTP